MTKKFLALLVAAMMVLALVPMGASAKSATRSANVPMRDDILIDGSLLYEDWDGDSLNNPDWWLYNADGESVSYNGDDYSNWVWTGFTSELHTGTDCMVSWSYKTGSGWTQDNWLITPDLNITTAGYMLGYYAMSYSPYYEDHLEVLVGELGVAYDYDSEGYYIDEDSWTTLISRYAVSGDDFYQVTASLDAYVGKTIAIAFRHQDTNQWAVMLDDVSVGFAGEPEPTPEPTPEPELGDLVQGYYFEEGSNAENFTFIDKDGDGYNWMWQETLPETNQMTPYEGEGLIYSESYHNSETGSGGTELNPDNWAITPAVQLPNETAALTLYAMGQDEDWAEEVFGIFVGTTADPDSMTKVGDDVTVTGVYTMYYFDLSEYAGQTVYIAIRHYNITNMFMLNVDQVEVWGTGNTEPPTPETYTVTYTVNGEYYDEQEYEAGDTIVPPAFTVPEGYTFSGWTVPETMPAENITVDATLTINTYTLTINYVDENGEKIAASVVATYEYGAEYSITSPEIPGYTPDIAVVSGTMTGDVEVTVRYFADEPPVTILLGDVDCNGLVNMADLALASSYVQNTATVTDQGILNGDINGDGLLTIADLAGLYNVVLG